MSPLRSVGSRLALALALVVVVALGILYLIVVPSLERNLVHAKLAQLSQTAQRLTPNIRGARSEQELAESAAQLSNDHVVVYDLLERTPPTLIPKGDSTNAENSSVVAGDPVARRTAMSKVVATGTVARSDESFGEAAFPIVDSAGAVQFVVLYSAPLADSLGNVQLVRRRILAAALIALGVALVLGYLGASVFARRIRRLERAAEEIASGRFDQAVVDPGSDEIGQLADAFERMRRQLSQLDHARRAFVANASHELRTPLFSLGGFLELLDDEELDEATRREFVSTAREQVTRLTKLATELLDLSRIDAGRLHVERRPVDLRELAESVSEEFQPLARGAGGRLRSVDSSPALAVADAERVRQIARILVQNALRHTPPGTPVRLAASVRDGRVALVVEDDGPGIPAEHATHVFERFYRIEGARASGSGIGLAIARDLAVLMDGELTLDSPEGPTRFVLVLPASAPRDPRGAPAGDEASVST